MASHASTMSPNSARVSGQSSEPCQAACTGSYLLVYSRTCVLSHRDGDRTEIARGIPTTYLDEACEYARGVAPGGSKAHTLCDDTFDSVPKLNAAVNSVQRQLVDGQVVWG